MKEHTAFAGLKLSNNTGSVRGLFNPRLTKKPWGARDQLLQNQSMKASLQVGSGFHFSFLLKQLGISVLLVEETWSCWIGVFWSSHISEHRMKAQRTYTLTVLVSVLEIMKDLWDSGAEQTTSYYHGLEN